jgi:hypothetical protein
MAASPAPARVKSARIGLVSANGRLPEGWINESADTVMVDHVDLSPEGPGLTVTLGFSGQNASPFVSVVLGDYLPVENGGVATLRVDVEMLRARRASAAFLVVREWIAGGTYVGQATRPIAGDGLVSATAARMATGDSRLFQPLLTIRRDGGAGDVTVRLRRVMFADLHEHPTWLAA